VLSLHGRDSRLQTYCLFHTETTLLGGAGIDRKRLKHLVVSEKKCEIPPGYLRCLVFGTFAPVVAGYRPFTGASVDVNR
jgi:hypothetical protein